MASGMPMIIQDHKMFFDYSLYDANGNVSENENGNGSENENGNGSENENERFLRCWHVSYENANVNENESETVLRKVMFSCHHQLILM